MLSWELKRNYKNSFLHIAIYGLIIIVTVLFIHFFDQEGLIANKSVRMLKTTPDMLKNAFIFLKSEIMNSSMKAYLFLMLLLFLPVTHYAMVLPLRSFEKDEDYGTISYICNGVMNRHKIYLYKVLANIILYLIFVSGLLLISEVLLLVVCMDSGHRNIVAMQVLYIWISIFVVGILMMAVSTLYVSLKNKRSDGHDFIFGIIQCLVLIRIVPFVLAFVGNILRLYGRDTGKVNRIIDVVSKVEKWIPLFWSNPLVTYIKPVDWMQTGICIGAATIFCLIGFLQYRFREFGEWE